MRNLRLLVVIIFSNYLNLNSQALNWLDQGFGTGGLVVTNNNTIDVIKSIVLQSDGKIVATGHTNNHFIVARYDQNGILDNSFNGTGIVLPNINGSSYHCAETIGIQSDEKIIVSGSFANGLPMDVVVLRLLQNGIVDSTFGVNGLAITSVNPFSDYASCMAIQPDDKIVVGGYYGDGVDGGDIILIRYNPNGTLDTTFSGDGMTIDSIGTYNDYVHGLALQSDGKILLTGYTGQDFNDLSIILGRFNSNGSIDSSFSNDGKIVLNLGPDQDVAWSVKQQQDGKIVVAGGSDNGNQFTLIRFNTNGDLDSSFNLDGIMTNSYFGYDCQLYDLSFQPDDKIICVGTICDFDSCWFAINRILPNGNPDSTFNLNGLVTTQFPMKQSVAMSVLIQPDGKIVAGGYTADGVYDFALARYMPIVYAGIDPIGLNIEGIVYPNPSMNYPTLAFYLEHEEFLTIEIADISGRIVSQIANNTLFLSGQNTYMLEDFQNLNAGVYFINLMSKKGIMTFKTIKQ